jgi:cobalt-zinc-cadmium efflux system outer membrane protein
MMQQQSLRRRTVVLALVASAALASLAYARPARAEGSPATNAATNAPAVELPALLTLDEAVRTFKTRGLDLLVADAAVTRAEGDVLSARAVANPNVAVSAGAAIDYNPPATCVGCQSWTLSVQLSDNGAVFDSLTGKRGLRASSARAALAAARLGRVDAERAIGAQLKQQYAQLVVAKASQQFAGEVQKAMTQSLDLNKLRYPSVINEGDLARIEVQKLEADQTVDQAKLGVRQAQVGVAYLLGVRGSIPDFDVERTLLKFRVPASLQNATEGSLVALAVTTRADLRAWGYTRESAEQALALAKRQRFPDVGLFANYTQFGTGANAVQPPTVTVGLSFPLPVFYQQQGEVRRAEADVSTATVQREKTLAQVVSDVASAWATWVAARDQVQRMESNILDRAKRARDIVDLQFRGGTATLMDFLDAERTYIAANEEYLQDLAGYWSALFALEQAVGTELP